MATTETDLREVFTRNAHALDMQLPTGTSIEKFQAVVILAFQNQPDLAKVSPESLFREAVKAARDGLVPDGKEGVILAGKEKIKGANGQDQWIDVARWQPMAYGIRKRARELDNIDIQDEVVFSNEEFLQTKGDDPKIVHNPVKLGNPKGDIVGAYAIFRKGDRVIHREVMDRDQVMAVKAISKNQNGLLWNSFADEAFRKSVLRRGMKRVPVSEAMRQLVERFDDNFDVNGQPAARVAVPSAPRISSPVPSAPRGLPAPAPGFPMGNPQGTHHHAEAEILDEQGFPAGNPQEIEPPPPPAFDSKAYLLELKGNLEAIKPGDKATLDKVWGKHERDPVAQGALGKNQKAACLRIYSETVKRIDGVPA